jgi:Glycosyl transferase family 2
MLGRLRAFILVSAFGFAAALEFTICTTVQNEALYMPEWLEYYRLHGVTRVVIGDHRSVDGLRHLAAFYAARPGADTFEVVVLPNLGEQTRWLNECARRYKRSDWIAFLDNDEFVWSPRRGSLLAYLDRLPKDVTQVHAFDLRFGVGDWEHRPFKLVVHPRALTVASGTFQLVTEVHVRRAPSLRLGEHRAYNALPPMDGCNATRMREVYGERANGGNLCTVAFNDTERVGKSFVRGYAFGFLGHPHYAQVYKGISHRETDLEELRINHYWVRSRSDARRKARQWHKHDPVEWAEHALPLQHAVEDRGLLDMHGAALRAGVRQFAGL